MECAKAEMRRMDHVGSACALKCVLVTKRLAPIMRDGATRLGRTVRIYRSPGGSMLSVPLLVESKVEEGMVGLEQEKSLNFACERMRGYY